MFASFLERNAKSRSSNSESCYSENESDSFSCLTSFDSLTLNWCEPLTREFSRARFSPEIFNPVGPIWFGEIAYSPKIRCTLAEKLGSYCLTPYRLSKVKEVSPGGYVWNSWGFDWDVFPKGGAV